MFLKRQNPHGLAVSMAGAKMGDRLLQVGCAHGGRLGAVAVKVGLSGRAAAVVPDEASADRARKGGAEAGVLVDVEIAPASRLPHDNDAFDLVVADDTGGLFGTMRPADRAAAVRELARVLRPGGRVVMIGTAPRAGIGAILSRGQNVPSFVSSGDAVKALEKNGFRSARIIGEREGLAFVEAIKPRDAAGARGSG
jgi:ubiquinone/menaquinone biosynthesis C-methylase UbiE